MHTMFRRVDLLSIVLPLLLLAPVIHAQSSYTPEPSYGPTFVAIEGKALYVQGGKLPKVLDYNIISQTFSIDLSKPWDVTAPLYSKMPDGIPGFQHPSALMKDNLSWLILVNQKLYTYNLANNTISGQTTVPEAISGEGFSAAINPLLDSFFVPNGYNNSGIQSSLEYAPGSSKATSIDAYSPLTGNRFYAMARSNYANAAFVFGGNRWDAPGGNALTDNFLRFNYQERGWTPVYSTGGPSQRDSSCMASAYNGTKLVLFGGVDGNWDSTFSDIYIYNVVNNTWEKGQVGGDRRMRASPACTVSGDFFIVYGGFSNKNSRSPPVELTSVYNLKMNTWVNRYEPSAATSAASGLSVGAIAGSVVGGVAVIAGMLFFVLFRQRKRNINKDADLQLDPTLSQSKVVAPKKEENFPLMVHHHGMSTPVDPYAKHGHQSELNVDVNEHTSRSTQGWPSSEARGPQYVRNSNLDGRHPSTFAEAPSSARNPQAHPTTPFP